MTALPSDPVALLRSRQYLSLLVLAALIGAPVSAVAYGFLALVHELETWIFTDIPKGLGFHSTPVWWSLLPLFVAGVSVALTIRYLPGRGGHSPADGFKPAGALPAVELPGVFLAALATLSLGVVLGPEAPLIALGGGLAVVALRLLRRDAPETTATAVAATGSFAAVATLFGSPILGAFLLMEVSGLGGTALSVVLVPGLLAAGTGSLIFIGLGNWSGLGPLSLAIPDLPHVPRPNAAELGWAVAIGLAAIPVGWFIRRLALTTRAHVERRLITGTVLGGLAVGGLAISYAEGTGRPTSDVLFSGQTALGPLLTHASTYTAGTLLLLLACKGLAYGVSLSSFRGGPIFPAMFLGATGGLLVSHLPGLDPISGAAMGIGAMTVVMLRLPLTSVLLATVILSADGLALTPLVIVAVVVAYVASARLIPVPVISNPASAGAGEVPASP